MKLNNHYINRNQETKSRPANQIGVSTRSNTKPALAYHYTTGQKYREISNDGCLIPADSYMTEKEKPILWFSLETDWEPTAVKAVIADGQLRSLSRWETFQYGGGLFRFGVSTDLLTRWPRIGKLAKTPKLMQNYLTESGKKQGASPKLWMGSLSPIDQDDWTLVETWEPGESIESGKWVNVIPKQIAPQTGVLTCGDVKAGKVK